MSDRVRMNIEAHMGYAPTQITDTLTLESLAHVVAAAIEKHGPDAEVIVHTGASYGADWGRVSVYDDIFEDIEDVEDDDDDEEDDDEA